MTSQPDNVYDIREAPTYLRRLRYQRENALQRTTEEYYRENPDPERVRKQDRIAALGLHAVKDVEQK